MNSIVDFSQSEESSEPRLQSAGFLNLVIRASISKFGQIHDCPLRIHHSEVSSVHERCSFAANQTKKTCMRTEHSHVRTIVNHDGAAILNPETGTITALNSTGAFVWQALERGEDAARIARDLARETGTQTEAAERDVRQFIEDLRNRKLVAP